MFCILYDVAEIVINQILAVCFRVKGADFFGFMVFSGVERCAGLFEARTDSNGQAALYGR